MARDEIPELRDVRDRIDKDRELMMRLIFEAIERGESNARIARSVDWSREYIAKLRREGPKAPRGEGR
ncbi:hypothetical protein [Streptomonospora arabica]|uniref:Uncharacterized protein n=1 Tax=Streptomonospora arabica TaxID=412417 RepID=A0ABV9SSK3_9ACTN